MATTSMLVTTASETTMVIHLLMTGSIGGLRLVTIWLPQWCCHQLQQIQPRDRHSRRSACVKPLGEPAPDIRSRSFCLGGGFEVDVGEFAIGQPFSQFCDQADGF